MYDSEGGGTKTTVSGWEQVYMSVPIVHEMMAHLDQCRRWYELGPADNANTMLKMGAGSNLTNLYDIKMLESQMRNANTVLDTVHGVLMKSALYHKVTDEDTNNLHIVLKPNVQKAFDQLREVHLCAYMLSVLIH